MTVVTLPYALTAGQNENVNQLTANLLALQAGINGIDTAQINPQAVTDAKLASPNNSVYRSIWQVGVRIDGTGGVAAAIPAGGSTYLLGAGANGSAAAFVASASAQAAGGPVVLPFYLSAADYLVAGMTTKLRLRALYGSNAAAAAGTTLTVGLNAANVGSAVSNQLFVSAGASQVSVPITTPPAAAFTPVASADINLPTDGAYVLTLVPTATPAAGHSGLLGVQVQIRNV